MVKQLAHSDLCSQSMAEPGFDISGRTLEPTLPCVALEDSYIDAGSDLQPWSGYLVQLLTNRHKFGIYKHRFIILQSWNSSLNWTSVDNREGVGRAVCLSRSNRREFIFLLWPVYGGSHILWLVAPFHVQLQQWLVASFFHCTTLLPLSFTYKDP